MFDIEKKIDRFFEISADSNDIPRELVRHYFLWMHTHGWPTTVDASYITNSAENKMQARAYTRRLMGLLGYEYAFNKSSKDGRWKVSGKNVRVYKKVEDQERFYV